MTNLCSTWYAADLELYNNEYKVSLLSAHKEVINFCVESWPHLLMVVKSGFERGPGTFGLDHELFFELHAKAECATEICFNKQALTLYSEYSSYSINWRGGKRFSFAPVKIINLEHNKALSAIKQCRYALEKIDLNTPSAVLLGMNGGADYFRTEIAAFYPKIIISLLTGNEQEFINSCRKIIGMGHGSSPSGDDLICGALFAYHHFVADQSFIDNISLDLKAEAKRTNIIGEHMIGIGLSGFTPDVFKELMISITTGNIEPNLLKRAFKIGSSTGIDILIALIVFTKSYVDCTEDSNMT